MNSVICDDGCYHSRFFPIAVLCTHWQKSSMRRSFFYFSIQFNVQTSSHIFAIVILTQFSYAQTPINIWMSENKNGKFFSKFHTSGVMKRNLSKCNKVCYTSTFFGCVGSLSWSCCISINIISNIWKKGSHFISHPFEHINLYSFFTGMTRHPDVTGSNI